MVTSFIHYKKCTPAPLFLGSIVEIYCVALVRFVSSHPQYRRISSDLVIFYLFLRGTYCALNSSKIMLVMNTFSPSLVQAVLRDFLIEMRKKVRQF